MTGTYYFPYSVSYGNVVYYTYAAIKLSTEDLKTASNAAYTYAAIKLSTEDLKTASNAARAMK